MTVLFMELAAEMLLKAVIAAVVDKQNKTHTHTGLNNLRHT